MCGLGSTSRGPALLFKSPMSDLSILPRTHQHILVIDVWPLFGTLAHVPRETLAQCRSWDPPYAAPSLLVVKRHPRTGWYTSTPVSSFNLFSKDTKSSPGRPTWLGVTGREQCTEVTLLCARFNLCTRVLTINCCTSY